MGKLQWIKKKIIDNTIVITGGLVGGAAVWLTFYFIFHFDTWSERLIYIFGMYVLIYFLTKIIGRFTLK